MTIREWIRNKEISGYPTFSVHDVRLAFPDYSEQVVRNELFRLSSQGILYPAYRGFYVIIPPQYAAKKMVPPIYYIEQLMSYLNKPYYISLLNAAEILGAAHQRPQKFSVMTVFPKSSVSSSKNNSLVWGYRKHIPSDLSGTSVDVDEILRCYRRYMSFTVQQPPTCKQFINNMEEKMSDSDFLGDTQCLIRPDREFNPHKAYEIVKEKLIDKL